jgi:hypothetical protein
MDFVSLVALGTASVAAFGITIAKVPAPEKVPWGLGVRFIYYNTIVTR